ncbi:MAG: CdaR family protein [Bryobacteraceae bacterium]
MSRWRQWIFNNWALKLTALGLSFLIWATYTSEPFAEVGYIVPIEFQNIPAGLEMSGDVPVQANVRLRWRSALLRRITTTDIVLSVDLRNAKPGEFKIRFDPAADVKVPYGASVERVDPGQLHFRLVAAGTPAKAP